MERSLFRDFKKRFLHSGKDSSRSPHIKKKSPTFSALVTAEGNVFVIYFFLSVSIRLLTQVAVIFFFVVPALLLLLLLFLLLTFCTWFGRAVLGNKKTKNVALRVQMFRIIPTGCFLFWRVGVGVQVGLG